MSIHIHRSLFVVAVLAMGAGDASAQGYTVRTWGYYDPVPYPPLAGGTYSYTIGGRPTVTLHDPWGRIVEMPLQPKVLYYDMPFVTTQGWYRPTSIAVMPDSRPRTYVAPRTYIPPGRPDGPPPPKAALPAPAPAARSTVLPDVKSTGPVPTVPVSPPRADEPGSGPPPPKPGPPTGRPAPRSGTSELPSIPTVPDLPDVPKAPGAAAGPTVPKLGPAPTDVPPKK